MGNYLKMADKERIQALLELGWSYRRIERETGVRRETIARYDPRRDSKAARVPAGPVTKPAMVPTGSASACERYREIIEASVVRGLSAQRIWQDLQEDYCFHHGYDSVKRFVRSVKRRRLEIAAVMEHPPGRRGPGGLLPRAADPGLGHRPVAAALDIPDGVILLPSQLRRAFMAAGQDYASFIRAHENAFLDFGGMPRIVRLDNLKAGVARACLYDPDVSELYAAFAKHWGFVPLPSRPPYDGGCLS